MLKLDSYNCVKIKYWDGKTAKRIVKILSQINNND